MMALFLVITFFPNGTFALGVLGFLLGLSLLAWVAWRIHGVLGQLIG